MDLQILRLNNLVGLSHESVAVRDHVQAVRVEVGRLSAWLAVAVVGIFVSLTTGALVALSRM